MQRHQRVQTPRPKQQRKRMPLKTVVKKVVDKWSESYLEGAEAGHIPSLLKLAELQHTKAGFGRIKYNPTQGRRWVEYATTTTNDPKATEQMRKLVVKEEIKRDKLLQLQRYQMTQGEHEVHQFDPQERESFWMPKGKTQMWHYNRTSYDEKQAGRARAERELAKQGITQETDPLWDEKVKQWTPTYSYRNQDDNMRIQKGRHPVLKGWPSMPSRFEQNYAIKAVLDQKMQRKITDPMPRPIHEYIMVPRTPLPEFVDPVTQSMHFAEVMKDSLKTNLETAITGNTYIRGGAATLADTPVIPTPVGTLRRYTDIVDEEKFNMQNITIGKPTAYIDQLSIFREMVQDRFWPTADEDLPKLVRQLRQAYKKTLDQEEFQRIRPLQFEDDQEWHGAISSTHKNPHFKELNDRSDADWAHLNPMRMWDGDDWTDDEDLRLDNFRAINLGYQMSREDATPVDSGGRFPYNGFQRRTFFLMDPFNAAKPWVSIALSGSERGEEEEPLSANKQMFYQSVFSTFDKVLPKDPADTMLPEMPELKSKMVDRTAQGLFDRMIDPHPMSNRNFPRRTRVVDLAEEAKLERRVYSTENYLTRSQYATRNDSIINFDPTDKKYYVDIDPLDVRKLPKTKDPVQIQAQIDGLVSAWLEAHQIERSQANIKPSPIDREYNYHEREDARRVAAVRHSITNGRDSHADFALHAATGAMSNAFATSNKYLDRAHKNKELLKQLNPNAPEIDAEGNFHLDEEAILDSNSELDIERNAPPPIPQGLQESPKITRPARISRQEARKLAEERLEELRKVDPEAAALETVERMMFKLGVQVDSEEEDHVDYEENSNIGWIKPIDLDVHLGDDGYFAGYGVMGSDPHKYTHINASKYEPQADGKPRPVDGESFILNTVKRFQRCKSEVFAGLELPSPDFYPEDEDHRPIEDEIIRKQLVTKLTTMVNDYQDGKLDIEEISSEDENRFEIAQPFLRPYIETYGEEHPFWNRVTPNPAIFAPGAYTTRKNSQRRSTFEEEMWNDYAAGNATHEEIQQALYSPIEFLDPARGKPVYYDQLPDLEKQYSRPELNDLIASGRFVVARRSQVDAIPPVQLPQQQKM